jgi:hypothetical protein
MDFDEAQRQARWHYQWIILNEFLPAMPGERLFDRLRPRPCRSTRRRIYE